MTTIVRIRTESSQWWTVLSRPSPTTIKVVFNRADGTPSSRAVPFEACAICFNGDPKAVHEQEQRSGFCVPPVIMGRCSWCGFPHDSKVALASDAITSDAKARQAHGKDGEEA